MENLCPNFSFIVLPRVQTVGNDAATTAFVRRALQREEQVGHTRLSKALRSLLLLQRLNQKLPVREDANPAGSIPPSMMTYVAWLHGYPAI